MGSPVAGMPSKFPWCVPQEQCLVLCRRHVDRPPRLPNEAGGPHPELTLCAINSVGRIGIFTYFNLFDHGQLLSFSSQSRAIARIRRICRCVCAGLHTRLGASSWYSASTNWGLPPCLRKRTKALFLRFFNDVLGWPTAPTTVPADEGFRPRSPRPS